MVKPIPAVGLASALVQTIDFSINTLRKDHAIYQPTHPSTPPVENAACLQTIIHNLYTHIDAIDLSELKSLHTSTPDKKPKKLSEPAQQLLKLADQTKDLAATLITALSAAQAKGTYADPRWSTARAALLKSVWKKGDVTGAKKKFRSLRRDVDTALLAAMKGFLEQSAETGLPVLSANATGERSSVGHVERWQNEALDAVHGKGWKVGKKKDMEEWAGVVDRLVGGEKEERFFEGVMGLLGWEESEERVNGVVGPDGGAYEWVFGESGRVVGGLLEWFGSARGEGVFWVTGMFAVLLFYARKG